MSSFKTKIFPNRLQISNFSSYLSIHLEIIFICCLSPLFARSLHLLNIKKQLTDLLSFAGKVRFTQPADEPKRKSPANYVTMMNCVSRIIKSEDPNIRITQEVVYKASECNGDTFGTFISQDEADSNLLEAAHEGVQEAAGVWRLKAIEDVSGWKDRTIMEDMDHAVRDSLKGWIFVFVGNQSLSS
ncbi:putative glucomannan 4-beta-mannosyltransferase [Helianthus debilis subsp. tardiflorus]